MRSRQTYPAGLLNTAPNRRSAGSVTSGAHSGVPGAFQMKDPLSYRPAPETQEDIDRSMLFERARKFLTLKDVIVLACIVACAYVVSANFGETTPWGKLGVEAPHGQTDCSDEELRHLRAGLDACFDPSNLHRTESDREPTLRTITNT